MREQELCECLNHLARGLNSQIACAHNFTNLCFHSETEEAFWSSASRSLSSLAAAVDTFQEHIDLSRGLGSKTLEASYAQSVGQWSSRFAWSGYSKDASVFGHEQDQYQNRLKDSSGQTVQVTRDMPGPIPQLFRFSTSNELKAVSYDDASHHKNRSKKVSCLSRNFVIRPDSLGRLMVDVISLAAISTDLLTLPLQVFDFDRLPWASSLRLATTIFWTIDLPLTFFMGYYNSLGEIETRLQCIAKKYLRTWFFPSLAIVTADWCLKLVLDDAHGSAVLGIARFGKALRITRVLRFLRMVRVVQLKAISEAVGDYVFSPTTVTTVSVLKRMFCVGIFCHFVACGWYAVGIEPHDDSSWVQAYNFRDASMTFRYVVAFHWAFAQFTPAPPPKGTSPTNLWEELFVICLFFVGLVIFSSLIGSVSARLTTARSLAMYESQQGQKFREYVQKMGISNQLGSRILHFVKKRNKSVNSVTEDDVHALRDLPKSTFAELRFEVFSPILMRHLVFLHLSEFAGALSYVCSNALAHKIFSAAEEVCSRKELATDMIFILRSAGKPPRNVLEYRSSRPHAIIANDVECVRIKESQFFCEIALWCSWWKHSGFITALQTCDVMYLNGEKLRSLEYSHPHAWAQLTNYKELFAKRVLEELENDPHAKLDFFGSAEDVTIMAHEAFPIRLEEVEFGTRHLASFNALFRWRRRHAITAKSFFERLPGWSLRRRFGELHHASAISPYPVMPKSSGESTRTAENDNSEPRVHCLQRTPGLLSSPKETVL